MDTAWSMVTKAMKHTLIISTTTCGEGVDAGGGGQRAVERARVPGRAAGLRMARIVAIGREGGTHRRDLEPRRVVRVVTQHGHVVTLLSARRGAGATPGVPASQAAPCSSRPRIEGFVKVRIGAENGRNRDAGARAGVLDSGGVRARAHRKRGSRERGTWKDSTCFLGWSRSSRPVKWPP